MEISEQPYDNRFHAEVKQIDVTDPEIEKFFFDLGSENKQSRKNLMIEKKYRKIIANLDTFTEDQILQYASVFLNFGTDAQLYTGTMMKKWQEQNNKSELVTGTIQVAVSEDVSAAT